MDLVKRCTFSVHPEIDQTCQERAIWEVHYTSGSGAYLSTVLRCDTHVASTIGWITAQDGMVYPNYRFNGITRVEK